jgi:hypothetical protein
MQHTYSPRRILKEPIPFQFVAPGGSGSVLAEMQAEESEDTASQLRTMRSLISRLTSLQVDPTEYACLKAIVLFKPGNDKLLSRNFNLYISHHYNHSVL